MDIFDFVGAHQILTSISRPFEVGEIDCAETYAFIL